MSNEEPIKRGEVKAFRQLFVHYSDDYPDGRWVSAVTIEDIDSIQPVQHEMTARELLHIVYIMFQKDLDEYDEYDRYALTGRKEEAVQFVENWALKHPEEVKYE